MSRSQGLGIDTLRGLTEVRADELKLLGAAFAEMCSDGSRALVISGAIGSGRSLLLDMFLERIRSRARVVDVTPGPMPAEIVSSWFDTDETVVVAVDDAHLMDPADLRRLTSALRSHRAARVLLLLTHPELTQPSQGVLGDGLPGPPLTGHVWLRPLTAAGVPNLEGTDAIRRTGGNLRLLAALLTGPETYRRAVAATVRKCDAAMTAVLGAAAVLDGSSIQQPSSLSRLDPFVHEQALVALDSLLDDGRFRHEAAAAVVLAELGEAAVAELHMRVADALTEQNAPVSEVARALVGAQRSKGEHAAHSLALAASAALDDGRSDRAVEYLELRMRATPPPDDDARTALIDARWRCDPAAAAGQAEQLANAAAAGALSTGQVAIYVTARAWAGDADAVAAALAEAPPPGDSATGDARLRIVRDWIELLTTCAIDRPDIERIGLASADQRDLIRAVGLLKQVLRDSLPPADSADSAVRLLCTGRLSERTAAAHCTALVTLALVGRTREAEEWSVRLRASTARCSSTWRALLDVLAGQIAMRLGRLEQARALTRSALDLLPAGAWGAGFVLPITTLVQVATASGHEVEAAELLELPVPLAALRTLPGMLYRAARGRHLMASDARAAAAEFHAVGELAADLGVDNPSLLPWRTELAEADLLMGRVEKAHALAVEQLAMCGERHTVARACALRILAVLAPLPERMTMLADAVHLLDQQHSWIELARALMERAAGHHAADQPTEAAAAIRRAATIATITGAAPPAGIPWVNPTILSNAELKVAYLAARGMTNRKIADELFVTVSTVEQHLTRMFRKLGVNSRAELSRFVP